MIQCCFIVDIDECTVYGPREICPFMTNCINTVGSYICQCMEPGFVGDGKQCVGKEGDGLVDGGGGGGWRNHIILHVLKLLNFS